MKTPLKSLLTLAALSLLAPWAASQTPSDLIDAEVRKIDPETGKITLKHGEIKSLDMPAMTMVFAVKDRADLARLKAGDKIRFRALKEAGTYTATEIQPVR